MQESFPNESEFPVDLVEARDAMLTYVQSRRDAGEADGLDDILEDVAHNPAALRFHLDSKFRDENP
jgi:hypothetical protein